MIKKMNYIKHICRFSVILGLFIYSSCNGSKYGKPVEDPSYILNNFMTFWYYWNDNVKLSLNFTALDLSKHQITKEFFLKKLSSGLYLPLRLKTNASSYCYQLYKLPDSVDIEIGNTISDYGERHYHYFQMEGKPLPEFNFIDLDGNIYNYKTCRNKIIVINTWFIACSACRAEIPALNQLVNEYKGRHDIVFISLALDNKSNLKNFFKKNIFKYAIVPNMSSYISDTLGLSIFPTHIIIDKTGKVVNITNDYHQMEYALKKYFLK